MASYGMKLVNRLKQVKYKVEMIKIHEEGHLVVTIVYITHNVGVVVPPLLLLPPCFGGFPAAKVSIRGVL